MNARVWVDDQRAGRPGEWRTPLGMARTGRHAAGVQPWDPVTFASVAAVLAVTAGVATAAPAWRAARIAPAVALRSE